MSKRILVVGDQEDNRQIVRDLLTANDYDMTEAENGEQALVAVMKERPDLILMDIQLPVTLLGQNMNKRASEGADDGRPCLQFAPLLRARKPPLKSESKQAQLSERTEPNPT